MDDCTKESLAAMESGKGQIVTSSEGADNGSHGSDRAESQQINVKPLVAKRMGTGITHLSISMAHFADALGPQKSHGSLGGSRFIHLEVDNEGEEVEMEGIDLEVINGKGSDWRQNLRRHLQRD